jgi:DNA-binding beta-propeller fold protein YncE
MNMSKSILSKLLFGVIFIFMMSACDKDNPTAPKSNSVIGIVITLGDSTRVNYTGDQTVTGELDVVEGQLSPEYSVQFIDADQAVFSPSTSQYHLESEISDETKCQFYQHEGKVGGFEFHLDAREKEHGHTTVVFQLKKNETTVFTSKSIPIHVIGDEESVLAWIWAYDGTASALRTYHSMTGAMEAEFTANAHPMMHIIHAGPAEEPTIWMANGGMAYAFTSGFHAHGDHAHLETPEIYSTVATGPSPVHTGVSPDGMTVAFANDGDQTVSVIDVAGGSVQTVSHGSGHSAALLTGEYLITTSATPTDEKWAKVIDISANSVVATIETATGTHGDAFYAVGNTAFLACGDGIYIVDVTAKSLKKSLPYTKAGRTNFLYHGEESSLAVGLHKTESGTSDKILLLDMAAESLEYLTISGATLDWKIKDGYFALSQNGHVAVLADLSLPRVYHVNLQTKEVTTLTAPSASAAVATNFDGSHVWVLDKTSQQVSRIHVAHNERTDEFNVASGTERIFVTSFDGQVIED